MIDKKILMEINDGGDAMSLEQLMPLMDTELRQLAARYLACEPANHNLRLTALVNEVYLRLVDQQKVEWQNGAQFVGTAAKLMRDILLAHARDAQLAEPGGQNSGVRSKFDGESKIPRPPFNAEYLLYVLLRTEERKVVIGDLIEEYSQILERFTKRRADLWFYKQVAGSLLPLLRRALLKIGAFVWLGRILRRLIS